MSEKSLGADAAADVNARSASESDAATARHTEGPWLVSSAWLVVTEDARIVARCQPFELPELAVPSRECEPNAHLIAAAPEMLALLKDLIGPYGFHATATHHRRVRDLIRKAEGSR